MTADANDRPIENIDDIEVVSTQPAGQRLGTMVSVRLDAERAQLVRMAAQLAGVSQSEFLRQSAIDAARKALRIDEPLITGTLVASTLVIGAGRTQTQVQTRTEPVSGSIEVPRQGGVLIAA